MDASGAREGKKGFWKREWKLNPWGRSYRMRVYAVSPRTAAMRRTGSQKNPGDESSHWRQKDEQTEGKDVSSRMGLESQPKRGKGC